MKKQQLPNPTYTRIITINSTAALRNKDKAYSFPTWEEFTEILS